MNPILGWTLVVIALALGWRLQGVVGVLMAISVVVFWLLLQYSQALRAMRRASNAPIGHVDSAVMLNARLRRGLTMLQLIGLTRSLGRKLGDAPERWEWADPGGSAVTIAFDGGRLSTWELRRPAQ